jgi:uncharacterized protein (TIGR00369 family)
MTAPAGFAPDPRSSPFLDLVGPVLQRLSSDGRVAVALLVEPRHLNGRGTLHGGLLTALGDVALGRSAALLTDPPSALVTVTLTAHFVRPVRPGTWLTVSATALRDTRSMVFAQGEATADGTAVAALDAVFRRPG